MMAVIQKKDNKLSEDSVMMVHEASQKLRTFCALFRLTFFFQVTTNMTGLKCEPLLFIFSLLALFGNLHKQTD